MAPLALRSRLAWTALLLAAAACDVRTTKEWVADTDGEDPFGRRIAVSALGHVPEGDEERALRCLLRLKGSRKEALREEAITSIRRLIARGPVRLVRMMAQLQHEQLDLLEEALRRQPELLPLLMELLSRADDTHAPALGVLLRAYRMDGFLALLRAIASAPEPTAAHALSALRRATIAQDQQQPSADLVPAFAQVREELSAEPAALARLEEAWLALGFRAEDSPTAPLPTDPAALAQLLESANPYRAAEAAERLHALFNSDPALFEPFLTLGQQAQPHLHALGVLARVRAPSDTPVIREPMNALDAPSAAVRCAAVLALHHLLQGARHIPQRLEQAATNDASPLVRTRAQRAIEAISTPAKQ